MFFFDTSAGKIAYLDTKGSGFPIILVHGNSCSSAVFRKQIDTLKDKYRLIAVDLPGHGKVSLPVILNKPIQSLDMQSSP